MGEKNHNKGRKKGQTWRPMFTISSYFDFLPTSHLYGTDAGGEKKNTRKKRKGGGRKKGEEG